MGHGCIWKEENPHKDLYELLIGKVLERIDELAWSKDKRKSLFDEENHVIMKRGRHILDISGKNFTLLTVGPTNRRKTFQCETASKKEATPTTSEFSGLCYHIHAGSTRNGNGFESCEKVGKQQFSSFRPHKVNSLLLVPACVGFGAKKKKKKNEAAC